jgi:hypothetical protein
MKVYWVFSGREGRAAEERIVPQHCEKRRSNNNRNRDGTRKERHVRTPSPPRTTDLLHVK